MPLGRRGGRSTSRRCRIGRHRSVWFRRVSGGRCRRFRSGFRWQRLPLVPRNVGRGGIGVGDLRLLRHRRGRFGGGSGLPDRWNPDWDRWSRSLRARGRGHPGPRPVVRVPASRHRNRNPGFRRQRTRCRHRSLGLLGRWGYRRNRYRLPIGWRCQTARDRNRRPDAGGRSSRIPGGWRPAAGRERSLARRRFRRRFRRGLGIQRHPGGLTSDGGQLHCRRRSPQTGRIQRSPGGHEGLQHQTG